MRRNVLAFAVCVLLTAGQALAQTPPPTQTPPQTPPAQTTPAPTPPPFPADAKVAFVNLQAVVEQSSLGKESSEAIKKFDAAKTAELQTKAKELEGLRTKLNTQRELLQEAALQALAKEIDLRARQLQFDQENVQVEREQLQGELLQKFNLKVIPLVEEIRKERDLWMIFSVADAGVVAAHGGLDLSAELIQKLDASK